MLPETLGAAERTILSSVSTTDRSLGESPKMYSGMVEAFDCMEEISQPKQQTIPPLSTNFELDPRNGGEKGSGTAA
jgi:hypothetical protein